MRYIKAKADYIKKYGVPTCKCGCGGAVNFKRGKPNKYLKGHSSRVYDPEKRAKAARIGNANRRKHVGVQTCACGCGQTVKLLNKYVRGHFNKIKGQPKYDWMKIEYINKYGIPKCACGCGESVKFYKGVPRQYAGIGHNGRLRKTLPKPKCACGCGQLVAHRRNKHVKGHHTPTILTDDIRVKRSNAAKENWKQNRDKLVLALCEANQKPRKFSGQRSILHDAFEFKLSERIIKFKPEHRIYCKTCKLQMQFDYIINNNLIQLHGHYWHSLPHKQKYDERIRECIEKHYGDFRLFEIWEYDFLSPNKLTSIIDKMLDISTIQIEISKQHLKIDEINWKDADKFLFGQHYLGPARRSATCYGLYCKQDLVGVSCFATVTRKETATRLHIGHNDIRELIRFFLSPKVKSRNLASWFLSRACKNLNNKLLIAFSDPTFGHTGTIYKASGWKYDGETEPSYGYIDRYGNSYHKLAIYKHASRMKMTEKQLCDELSLVKIKTLPKKRFLLDRRL